MGSAARTRARAEARTAAAGASTRAKKSRQTLAARRAAERRAEVRRRLLLAGGSVAAVIAIVATLIVMSLTRSPAPSAPDADARTTAEVQRELASVQSATFDSVGPGTATGLDALTGQPTLTAGGKPEVLYIGGEFCPYCAAERWAIAASLSRFGALSGLSLIHSSPADVYASTPTLSFASASYSSKYLAFARVEWYGEAADPSTPFGHAYLQQPTAQEKALYTRYGGGSFPFLDIGNRYTLPQAQYVPSALAGLSWTQVVGAMHDPSSPVAKDIDGAANILTAAICTLTHGQPGGVCHSAGVKAAVSSTEDSSR